MKKTIIPFAAMSLMIMASCKNVEPGNPSTLDIFATNAGYGIDWINDSIKEFKELDWVKEKYPDLTVNFGPGDYDTSSSIGSKITSGSERVNKYDLLFTCNPCGDSFGKNINTTSYEEFTELYSSKIPGESISIEDKMQKEFFDIQKTKFPSDEKEYIFSFPWVLGSQAIVYNETKLQKYIPDYELPRTTNELIKMLETLTPAMKEDEDAPWLMLNGGDYNDGTLNVWWAQYEGVANYTNYFEGKNAAGEYSSDNYKQKGRLNALKTLEDLYQTEFIHEDSYLGVKKFMTIQNRFVRGLDGIFMFQGDWFENENKSTITDQVFNWMKNPVSSYVIEKCDSIDTDESLSKTIKVIDEDKTFSEAQAAVAGLSEHDYEYIKTARNINYVLYGHQAHIPNYSSGKEVAKDFLAYMASDKGISTRMKSGKGYQTGFNYTADEETEASFSKLQKTRYEIGKTSVSLKPKSSFYLFNFGGLTAWKNIHPEQAFTASLEKDRKTAEQLFNEEVEYFTKDNSANFKNILKQAGINI